jgi:hypothetical protein
MILRKYLLTTLYKWVSVLCFTVICLLSVGSWADSAITNAATVGHMQEVTEKITDQPSCVFELSMKSKDRLERTGSTHFTFLCQEVSLPFIQDTWTFSNISLTM